MTENVLYYGDNLDILRRYIKDESIDLIYLDPPPSEQVNVTLKRAPKAKSGTTVTQAHLFHKERKQPAEN